MSKDPAFLFYPNDYIGGTMGMSFEEKGAYIELLMMQFNRGHMNEHMINHIVGSLWNNIRHKFKQDHDGLWYNERLDIEKYKRQKFTESRRNNRTGINQNINDSDDNETCIYIFKDLTTGNIKIGASVNPLNRLSTIKSRQGKKIKLIATAENCTLADEKELHKTFSQYHIKGDWFDINENDVINHMNNHMSKHMILHMENENDNVNEVNNINILFDDFWNLYDKKNDRVKCEAKWKRLTDKEREECIAKTPEYIKATPDKKFRKDPATYLNNKSWQNEIIKPNEINTGNNRRSVKRINDYWNTPGTVPSV